VCCSVLQCVAVRCKSIAVLQCLFNSRAFCTAHAKSSVLQCIAVSCSFLQCLAVSCSVLQCLAACCSVLQCVAVRCSALQCVASVLQCCSIISLHAHPAMQTHNPQKDIDSAKIREKFQRERAYAHACASKGEREMKGEQFFAV